jgi:hypothetical protein
MCGDMLGLPVSNPTMGLHEDHRSPVGAAVGRPFKGMPAMRHPADIGLALRMTGLPVTPIPHRAAQARLSDGNECHGLLYAEAMSDFVPILFGLSRLRWLSRLGQAVGAADDGARSLRDAAQRVLDAWDDEANQRCDLVDTMDALRIALAGKPTRRPARQGTKLLTVVGLLKQPGGTTVAQVCDATGWTKDTVRGFFVGLKKKGIRVEAVEKVRSVGPNRAGGRGSYTIYRVTEAGDA